MIIVFSSIDNHFKIHYRFPGGNTIERVSSYKLLGVYLQSDLSRNLHCDYITKKPNKRLYIVRILRRVRIGYQQLVTVYCSLIRPILEYAAPVWSAIPDCLKAKVEIVQKRAFKIIDPGLSYEESLQKSGLQTYTKRREEICKKFPKDNKLSGPLKKLFTYNSVVTNHEHNLRRLSELKCANSINTDRFLNFITCKY